jgi:hypothetical protein
VAGQHEDGVIGVDTADAAKARQRIGAFRDELGRTVLAEEGHQHEDILRADSEVHRAAHCGDRVRSAGVPVRQVPVKGHLECTEHTDIEVPSADHGEGRGVIQIGRAGRLGDGDLAGVDQLWIDVVAERLRAHAQHPVLGVQDDPAI